MSDTKKARVQQYENAPGEGLNRFWISWTSWLEDWPDEVPFFFWETGTTCDGRLRPSMKDDPRAANLPEHANMMVDFNLPQITDGSGGDDNGPEEEDDDLFDTFYVSGGTICAWIDAVDEEAAWTQVSQHFPDFEKRFCEERPRGTLSGNARGGRFGHPDKDPKERVVFMADRGVIVGAFLDRQEPRSDMVHTYEGAGRFNDLPRVDFRKMTIAQPQQYADAVRFLSEEFQIEVEPVNSVAELISTEPD